MTYKFNPFTNKLDYFLHQAIASYKFTGWTELGAESLVDPGAGNFYFDFYDLPYAVMSLTDINGYDMDYNYEMMYFGMEYYDFFLNFHGKTNSNQYFTMMIIPDEEWITITEGEGEEEVAVAYAIPIWPVLFPMTYDAEEDEFVVDEFPENDQVLFSADFAFNPDYLGSMGRQDYDSVDISGGIISNTKIYWSEIVANGATILGGHGNTTSTVADLQAAHDGASYLLNEEAETPGMDMQVDFINVTHFNWVKVSGRYQGSSDHSITIQLQKTAYYGGAWDTFDVMQDQPSDNDYQDYSFFVPNDTLYIDDGVVKVRFNHYMGGTVGHTLLLDCVLLYL